MAAAQRGWMARLWRWILALLLLPVCSGLTWALVDLLAQAGHAPRFWVPVSAGAGAWLVLFLSLPKPMWLYVVGHELTHALSVWLCGGKVKKFKVHSKGGYVVVSKTNTLITLSPYFFPFYAGLWVLIYEGGDALFGWESGRAWFHFGLGIAYAFHLTLTAHILRVQQPDLAAEGWVFSTMVIWLGNVMVLLLAVPLLTRVVTLSAVFGWSVDRIGRFLSGLVRLF